MNNKPRLPLDIAFLMEGILKEDPDGVYGVGDSGELEKLTRWHSSDAIPFFAFDTFSIISFGSTHYEIIDVLHAVYKKLVQSGEPMARELYEDKFSDNFPVSDLNGMLKELMAEKLKAYFEAGGRAGTMENGRWGTPYYREHFGISGRIWTNTKLISFWNKNVDVIMNWELVEKMFKEFSSKLGDIQDYRVDFLEREYHKEPLTPASSVPSLKKSSSASTSPKLSDEQIRTLQKKLHTLTPSKKKQVMNMLGKRNVKAQEFAEKLGMTVAQMNHLLNVNESEAINESPDVVVDENGKEIASYNGARDEWAFSTFDKFFVVAHGGTHYGIMSALYNLKHGDPISNERVVFSDEETAKKEIADGKLGKYLEKGGFFEREMGSSFRWEYGLCGRVWPYKKVISFWNKGYDVIKYWDKVVELFSKYKNEFGDLNHYRVDFIEREKSGGGVPLTPAASISSNKDMSDDTMDHKISPKELKSIQGLLHLLSPGDKKKALMAIGADNVKAAEKADAAGMTVAQMNFLKRADEQKIPALKDIIKII